jgi:16S rRNA processing protein RimM
MLVPEGAKAGKISKPYGLQGEVSVILEPRAGNNIEPDSPLFILIDGQRVPFFVEEVELLSEEQAIVKFEFLDSLEEAREVSGCMLYFDPGQQPEQADKDEDLATLVGYVATDKLLGRLGHISDYLPHPMNPLFVIETEDGDLMIPAVSDFIERIDPQDHSVHFILPEGITTL